MEEDGFTIPVSPERSGVSYSENRERLQIRYCFQNTVMGALEDHRRYVRLLEDQGGHTQALHLRTAQVDGSVVEVLVNQDAYEGVVHLLFNGGEQSGSMKQYYLDEKTRDVLLYDISKDTHEMYARRLADILGSDPAFADAGSLDEAVKQVYAEQAANRQWEKEWGLNDQPIDLGGWHYLNNIVQNGVPFDYI